MRLKTSYKDWKIVKDEQHFNSLFGNTILKYMSMQELKDFVDAYSNGKDVGKSWRPWFVGECKYIDKNITAIVFDREFNTEYNNSEIIIIPSTTCIISNRADFEKQLNIKLQELENTQQDLNI